MIRPSAVLIDRHGYYCVICLARALGLTVDDVRRYTRRSETVEVVTRCRMCDGCMAEKEVVGLRICT
jgi:hypothetical protein